MRPTDQFDTPTLGNHLSDHQLRREYAIFYPGLILLGLVGMLIALGLIIWRWFDAYRHFGPAVIWRWIAPAVWVLIICFALVILGFYLFWRSRDLRVSLFQLGLVLNRRKVRKTIRWDEIEQINTASVRYGIAWGTRKFVQIKTHDGLKIHLSNILTNINLLIKTIKQHVYPKLLSEFRQRINEGGSLTFGDLLLTKHGIQHAQQFLSWDSIEQVTLSHGMLTLTLHENDKEVKHQFHAHQIPNVDLCIQLLAYLRGVANLQHGGEAMIEPVVVRPLSDDETNS